MQNTIVRMMVHGKNYEEIMEQVEDKLSSFTNVSREDVTKKFNIDCNFFLSNEDGVTAPTYTAEVIARMRNHGQS
jgi:predicted nucleotidyltransferase